MARSPFVEDELGRRWDRCIYDGVFKFGGGLALGIVGSVLFFKRKSWPLIFGGGFGLGLAYGNCEREIQSVLTLRPKAIAHQAST